MANSEPTIEPATDSMSTLPSSSCLASSNQQVSSESRELLVAYSGYSEDEIAPMILRFRDTAYAQYHYPCIKQMRFLRYNLRVLPFYTDVVSRLKSGATFLDAGCGFGAEIRYLAHKEHIPISQLFGFDVLQSFLDLGSELFRDKDRIADGHLVEADVLAEADAFGARALNALIGEIDIVFASSFLHVFPLNHMIKAVKRLVELTRGRKDAIICGKQLGSHVPGHYPIAIGYGEQYRHNEKTLSELFAQVGRETHTTWQVEVGTYMGVELIQNLNADWADPGICMIWFCATKT